MTQQILQQIRPSVHLSISSNKEVDEELIGELTGRAMADTEDFHQAIEEEPMIHNKETAKGDNSCEMKFLVNQRKVMKQILSRPYTTHAIKNAFTGMCFGAWMSGIFDATFDDFMHSTEAGLMKYIGESVFSGLQPKERSAYESVVHKLITTGRSSIRNDYPRMRLGIGFSRQTLMTSSERVGTVFMLALSLQLPSIRDIIDKGNRRQVEKYERFPPKETSEKKPANKKGSKESEQWDDGIPEDSPMYYDRFFNNDVAKIGADEVDHTLEQLARHGYDLEQMKKLDNLQIHQLIVNVAPKLAGKNYPQSYPATNIGGYYVDQGPKYKVSTDVRDLVFEAMFAVHEQHHVLKKAAFVGVKGAVPKHHREKQKIDGVGATSAVLCDQENLAAFLEYVLCFHAFCKYSSMLPSHLRDSTMQKTIDAGGRLIVLYFERFIYRGDNSVDARTTKIHAQLRMGMNYEAILSPMHSSTELGERLLKTEAKGISSTAQQRGTETFERQTCSRIGDRLVLDKVGETLERQQSISDAAEAEEHNNSQPAAAPGATTDHVCRKTPHFTITRQNRVAKALDRKGNTSVCTAATGRPDDHVVAYLLENEPLMDHFELYNEVVIRNDTRIRAWPNYRQSYEPWFDYVDIQWEDGCHPGRALGFYKKQEEEETVLYALVHVVDERTKNKVTGTIPSILANQYRMKYQRTGAGNQSSFRPEIRIVLLASINTSILAYLHQPTSQLFDHRSNIVMAFRPRNEWAYIWLSWTEELAKANSKPLKDESMHFPPKARTNKKLPKVQPQFVPLNDKKLWKSVRDNLATKLNDDE